MHLDAWYKSMDFDIIITISINTRGFGAFLTKYKYNKYIYIYYIYDAIAYRYTYICIKCTQLKNALKINTSNSLSVNEGTLRNTGLVSWFDTGDKIFNKQCL